MAGSPPPRFPWASVSLFGWLTIVGYGTWYYSFGVLLEPILTDTGWSEEVLVSSFSATGLIGAFLAPTAGRLLDAGRARSVIAATAIVAAGGLTFASRADALWFFVAGTMIGGASLAAFAFYHVTQTLAVRVAAAGDAARAVGVLTLWGAFASTIYLPFAAVLVEASDWRNTLRVLALVAGAFLLTTAALLPVPARTATVTSGRRARGLLTDPDARRYATASFGIGLAVGIVLVYQVTIMVAAGLSLTTAAWLAGARGVTQFIGRLPIIGLVHRLGSTRSLRLAFIAIAIGCAFLAFSTHPAVGFGYVIIGGLGIGATSPLQGIHATTIFPEARLGQGMGTISLVFGVAMALGPTLVAIISDGDSVRWIGPGVAVASAALAAAALRTPIPATNAVDPEAPAA